MKKNISIIFAVIISVILFVSCAKEGPAGPAGANGTNGTNGANGATGATGATGQPGPDAKTFDFQLTYNAGDTYQTYSGITGFDANDVILFFARYETLGGVPFWSSIPAVFSDVNFIPEFSNTTGLVFINTFELGTQTSPWTSSITFDFRAVLIKSSAKNSNVNYNDYNSVKEYYHLVN